MYFLTAAVDSANIFIGLFLTMPRSTSCEVEINLDSSVYGSILQSRLQSSPIKIGMWKINTFN